MEFGTKFIHGVGESIFHALERHEGVKVDQGSQELFLLTLSILRVQVNNVSLVQSSGDGDSEGAHQLFQPFYVRASSLFFSLVVFKSLVSLTVGNVSENMGRHESFLTVELLSSSTGR